MLNNITPFSKFSDVSIGIRFGFDMGVHSPPLETYTPLNHNSALSFPDHVISHIHNELSLGRYSGPFSRSRLQLLIGPFRSSPLGTVEKSVGSLERRILQDLSFPRDNPTISSVNSQINIDDFRCDWGTFNNVRSIAIDAPPFSEAATLDVDAAFRCCPIVPLDLAGHKRNPRRNPFPKSSSISVLSGIFLQKQFIFRTIRRLGIYQSLSPG